MVLGQAEANVKIRRCLPMRAWNAVILVVDFSGSNFIHGQVYNKFKTKLINRRPSRK